MEVPVLPAAPEKLVADPSVPPGMDLGSLAQEINDMVVVSKICEVSSLETDNHSIDSERVSVSKVRPVITHKELIRQDLISDQACSFGLSTQIDYIPNGGIVIQVQNKRNQECLALIKVEFPLYLCQEMYSLPMHT